MAQIIQLKKRIYEEPPRKIITSCQDLIHSFYDMDGIDLLDHVGREKFVPKTTVRSCVHRLRHDRHAWIDWPTLFLKRTRCLIYRCCSEGRNRIRWVHAMVCTKCGSEFAERCVVGCDELCTKCGSR